MPGTGGRLSYIVMECTVTDGSIEHPIHDGSGEHPRL